MSVYTTIESDELENFLTNYNVGKLADFHGISDGIENTNYFVNTHNNDNKRYVLTIFEHHTFEEMQYYLNLMHHLADHQVPSANPVADNEGKYLRILKDKPAALVERLEGGSIRKTMVSHCKQIGDAMGRMHAAGLSFDDKQVNPRGPAWSTHTAKTLQDKLPESELQLLNEEILFQKSIRNIEIPRGVIHADLFRDNVLWHGDQLSGFIDFYYACDDALLYDLAVTVNDWCCLDDYSLDQEKVCSLLKAYHQHRPLLPTEQEYWPAMLRAGALRFWLSRLYDKHFPRPGELVHTKNPDEFKAILSDRVRKHSDYQAYWI
jgi:homoserine kinase type II